MWREYLGAQSHIYGIDVEPKVAESQRRINNFVGDVGDFNFLSSVCDSIGPIDVIVDAASRMNWHQRVAFEALYPCLNPSGGIYIVEDFHDPKLELSKVDKVRQDLL